MSCAGCSVGRGLPAGCKSNGSCSTGGCSKLNSFDWLADLAVPEQEEPFPFHEISFKNGTHKCFCSNPKNIDVVTGDQVVVDTGNGWDVAVISLSGEIVRLQMKKKNVKEEGDHILKIIRLASHQDLKNQEKYRKKEMETLVRSRAIARESGLDMKIGEVEYQADGKKATFYYTADGRVDFRNLIKEYAREFRVRIEMRQIGARQESGRIGGIGDCGRELCCSTWLTDFKSVSTSAARYQDLAINQSKLSGQCGRLKCCLNYELDTYLDALQVFPDKADYIETKKGKAVLQKKDIFRQFMWYKYSGTSNYYQLSVEKVKEMLEMNRKGKVPADLPIQTFEDENKGPDYEKVDDHISLEKLDQREKKKNRKKKKRKYGRKRRDR